MLENDNYWQYIQTLERFAEEECLITFIAGSLADTDTSTRRKGYLQISRVSTCPIAGEGIPHKDIGSSSGQVPAHLWRTQVSSRTQAV